jgi:hypothetical protein
MKAPDSRGDRRPVGVSALAAAVILSRLCGLPGLVPSPLAAEQGPVRGAWSFTDVTAASGFVYTHGYVTGLSSEPRMIAGGVAAGDYDGDGWVDLYAVRGDIGPNLLFRNRGDGTFEEVGAAAGVAVTGSRGAGPTFADVDGDGWLDLLIGGVGQTPPRLFGNRGDGTFEDRTAESGLGATQLDTYSAAFGDYDRDGDLDVALAHWNSSRQLARPEVLWNNDGRGRFTDVTMEVLAFDLWERFSFTPNFADVNGDGWPDVLTSADFGTSWLFLSDGDGTFTRAGGPEISDENGMGAALGDYDGDGDLDWFISSIWDPDGVPEGNWGITGNRLYRNRGDGTFEDVTTAAGVRHGYWGWGSCFADLDNDGHLDLFHVNGFNIFEVAGVGLEFLDDPARLFHANGDGTFSERSAELGVDDPGQGRGVVCFDYDRDGDLDLFIANNSQPPAFYRNDGGNAGSFLTLRLHGAASNRDAAGARVWVTAGGATHLREVRVGSNYASQSPPGEVHFGLGAATAAEEVRVEWPDGGTTVRHDVAANQLLDLGAACRVAPAVAVGSLGASQPVSARVTLDGSPAAGVVVTFEVLSGPHQGETAGALTGPDGRAQWSWAGKVPGTDVVEVRGVAGGRGFQCRARRIWQPPAPIFADGFESGDLSAWLP